MTPQNMFIVLLIAAACANQSIALQREDLSNRFQNQKAGTRSSIDSVRFALPSEFKVPIQSALVHFPELQNVSIEWRLKETYTPLSARPTVASMFKKKKKRCYIITISTRSIDTLRHILLRNLILEAQIGIIGHELSHIVAFRKQNIFKSIRTAIGHLSPKFIDKMEFNTDLNCIRHGLGRELESYSAYVRKVMNVKNWRGVDYVLKNDQTHERYMNPETIRRFSALAAGTP